MSDSIEPASGGPFYRVLRRVVEVEPAEVKALAWTWLYFFALLSSYYVIRPIRDEAGVAGGVNNLPWLWMGTLAGTTIANPPFSALVAKFPRVQFVAWTYRFFIANLVVLFLLLHYTSGVGNIWAGRVFYVWVAVFNLFVPSVFWGFMTDLFTREQGKRLFGFISAGGTLGGIAGSLLTAGLVEKIGAPYLLILSAALLELAVFSVRRLSRFAEGLRQRKGLATQEKPIGGGIISGITHAFGSGYMLAISLNLLLFAILSTFLYFQQAQLVESTIPDRAARTIFFARVDILMNSLTVLTQMFATGRLIKAVGLVATLSFVPAMSALGFFLLATVPSLTIVVWFQALRRAANFAIARPTREILFIVLPREDRYKAKSFIDTFIYRAGDQVGAWSYALMGVLSLGLVGTSWVAIPISIVALANAVGLGRQQERLAAGHTPDETHAPLTARPAAATLE
jgi:AAA family ATP:ADP antiporter